LDPAIRHTVVHHSSTSTYIPNFIQIEETFCGRTDVRTYGRTDGRTFFPPILLGRLLEVDLTRSSADADKPARRVYSLRIQSRSRT